MEIVNKFFTVVVDPAVRLLFAAALVYFIYGVFVYAKNGSESEARLQGGRHILWATIGLAIMFSVWGIMRIIKETVAP